jgi:hypothetical protein
MSNGLKIFLILLIVVVFGAIGYFLLSDGGIPSPSSSSSPLQTSTGAPVSGLAAQTSQSQNINADQVGQEFLAQLLNIRSIKLRDDIFSSPSFVSLVDYTIELIQLGNEGRVNPFAPFGIDGQNSFMEQGGFGEFDSFSFDQSFPSFESGSSFSSFGPGTSFSTGGEFVNN